MINNAFILLLFFLLLLLRRGSPIRHICPDISCQPGEPVVHFPFHLKQLQPNEHYVFPGFDLLCNGPAQMIINLLSSSEFIVALVIYSEQLIFLRDSGNCLSRRFHSLSLLGPQWTVQSYTNFAFIECSLGLSIFPKFALFPCLSDRNHMVVAIPTEDFERRKGLAMSGCVRNWTVLVPSTALESTMDDMLTDNIGLTWSEPTGGECHAHGAICGFKRDKGLEATGTHWEIKPEEDHPKSDAAKLESVVGIGLPWLMVILCVCCCISSKIRLHSQAQQNQTNPASSIGQVEAVSVPTGMDLPTIESYPKSQIGNGGLPLPRDGTCSICLSEYRSEETVRMIPKCNHYFHAHCIDQRLERNVSCPLCRNHQGSIETTVSS